MVYFENILYISILQLLPASLFFILCWFNIDNILLKNFLSILSFSLWITFNSICIRKSRYKTKGIIIFNSLRERVISENTLIISNDKKISIIRLIVILFPTTITIMFILIFFYQLLILFIYNFVIKYKNTEYIIKGGLFVCIALFNILTFYIGTDSMDWNRLLVSFQYGLTTGALYIIMVLNLKQTIFNLFIEMGLVFLLSIVPVFFEICICIKEERKISNRNLGDNILDIENGGESNNNSEENNLRNNRSIDNLIQYGSMEIDI